MLILVMLITLALHLSKLLIWVIAN